MAATVDLIGMPAAPGTRLGPYEIGAPIGAGGMGEVYQARDTRLGRTVAIKVADARFSERFEQEARAIAALNHPHICQLYDVGPNYLVMEMVEGQTLADRLHHGAIPIEESLAIARQIGAALEAAHERGIVHRDLKPANIKITPAGEVKVLDFGLAKMLPERAAGSGADANTATLDLTRPGTVLGTPGYMAPEQFRGAAADKRADIWAFGAVLYEMLTGKKATEPDWDRVPEKVRRLVQKCLETDPRRRLRDIGDAWLLLEEDRPPSPAPRRRPWPLVAVLASLLAIVSLLWLRSMRSVAQAPKPLARLDVDLGVGSVSGGEPGAKVIVSPAGDRLAFVAQSRLYTRRLDQPRAVELPDTDGAFAPFFSPDGNWIAFFARGKLRKISVAGGAPIDICDATTNARGGAWGEDDRIIAALGSNESSLSVVSAAGSKPEPLLDLDHAHGEITQRWPQILPGGKSVLFTANTSINHFDEADIEVYSLATRARRKLHRGGTYGRYLAAPGGGGYLVYVNRGTMFAAPFDLGRLAVKGTPAPVLQDVSYSPSFGSAEFDATRDGTLIYAAGGSTGEGLVTLRWLDSAGKTEPFLARAGDYLCPKLSPDGRRVALASGGDIWIYDGQQQGTLERLTSGGGFQYPLWSADGRFVIFRGPGGTYWTRPGSAAAPQPLTRGDVAQFPWSVTADGSRMAVQQMSLDAVHDYDIWTVALESDGQTLRAGKMEVFLKTPAREGHPAISPDGRWLAYFSDDSGNSQIYVRAFPDTGERWAVSSEGGLYPTWSRAAHELFFRTPDNRVMEANYRIEGKSFHAEKPRLWTPKRLANVGQWRNFDLAPDGKRIVALLPAEGGEQQAAHAEVIFLENFSTELRRLIAP